jgi:ABC-type branched-subunit amino acid transport system substrate-binding protein
VIVDFPESFAELQSELVDTGEYRPGTTWGADGLALELPGAIAPQAIDGLRGVVPGTPDADRTTHAFHRRYRAAKPKDVTEQPYDARNFDAVVLCYLAAVAAGSSDGERIANRLRAVSAPPGDPYTWEQLDEAIQALERGEEIDYQGASGGIDLNSDGDATAGVYYVYEYRVRELRVVDEVSVTPP